MNQVWLIAWFERLLQVSVLLANKVAQKHHSCDTKVGHPHDQALSLQGIPVASQNLARREKDSAQAACQIAKWLMTVLQGTLNRPWSTSTLVRMLPVAKKQPSPTSRVSGKVTCGTLPRDVSEQVGTPNTPRASQKGPEKG